MPGNLGHKRVVRVGVTQQGANAAKVNTIQVIKEWPTYSSPLKNIQQKKGRRVAKLVARLLVCLLRQLSGFEFRHLSKTKRATEALDWPTYSSPQKNIQKK